MKQMKLSFTGHDEQIMHQTSFQKVKVEFISADCLISDGLFSDRKSVE